MELKKSKNADLRNKQGLFFQVGMLVALALVFVSFQWSVEEKGTNMTFENQTFEYDEELILITRPEKQEEKIAPKPQAEILLIIDELNPIDGDDIDIDVSASEDTRVETIYMEPEIEVEENKIFAIVEDMPIFPGGDKALFAYFGRNIKYPKIAKENGIQGRVFIAFVINKKGEVVNVQIVRGVDPSLDGEALRVVRSLPNWTPGKQLNKAVNVSFNVPISFRLN